MTQDAGQRCPIRSEGVLGREADGRTVLLALQDGSYYALDGAGVRIWDLCDGERSLTQIAERLTAELDVGLDTAQADTEEFIAELSRQNLIHFGTGPG